MAVPYWEARTLAEMTQQEWESLCDGCGKCCLHKLEEEETGEYFYTCVACELLDTQQGGCRDYQNRLQHVSDCIQLRQVDIEALGWLPSTCSYRLIAAGEPLPGWHHLLTGDKNSVHEAGASIVGKVYDERQVDMENLEEYIVHWVD